MFRILKSTGHNKRYFSTFSSKPPKPPSQYGLLIIIIISCSLIRDYKK
jgi:hypothetical protein